MMMAEFAEIDASCKKRKLEENVEVEEETAIEEEEEDYIDVISTLGLGSLDVAN